jgi:hypothetical protein
VEECVVKERREGVMVAVAVVEVVKKKKEPDKKCGLATMDKMAIALTHPFSQTQ